MKGNVVRWTPFRELNQLQQEMNRLFDGTVLDWWNGEPADVSVWLRSSISWKARTPLS